MDYEAIKQAAQGYEAAMTQVYIASGRSYMSEERTNKINQRLDQLGRMIYGFMRRLENANPSIRRK